MRKNTWMIGAVLVGWALVLLADALGMAGSEWLLWAWGGFLGGWLVSRLIRGA